MRRIASRLRSTSSSVVAHDDTLIRMAVRPCHTVGPAQQVPSCCTRSITRSVCSAEPNDTSRMRSPGWASSSTAVSLLILSFLVPAVVFSAVAGVYVDRIDRRLILVATNVLRGASFVALYLVGTNLALILVLNVTVSTITVFFAPAEAAMIPVLLPRAQLLVRMLETLRSLAPPVASSALRRASLWYSRPRPSPAGAAPVAALFICGRAT